MLKAIYVPPGDIQSLENSLNLLERETGVKAFLFLMADEAQYQVEILKPLLRNVQKPVIGGIFPELIFRGERKKSGVILLPLAFELITQLFDLSETYEDFNRQLESVQKDSLDSPSSLFVFIDALSTNKESLIEALFNFFGINPCYFGGGAGSLNFKPFPCIITNRGIFTNAAVIGWSRKKIALGVAHGWHSLSESLKVTKANRNQLISINWKPAFEVYKEIVESHSGIKFNPGNFFHIAKSYPLGITKIDAEMVVRDPFMVKDNVLHLVDIINEGEYVEVLHGNMDSLLEGASNAGKIAFSRFEKKGELKSIFCIDCISRVLFMQDDFVKELDVIGKDVEVYGILTIGEIANSGESFLEIYNKTIVIGIW